MLGSPLGPVNPRVMTVGHFRPEVISNQHKFPFFSLPNLLSMFSFSCGSISLRSQGGEKGFRRKRTEAATYFVWPVIGRRYDSSVHHVHHVQVSRCKSSCDKGQDASQGVMRNTYGEKWFLKF